MNNSNIMSRSNETFLLSPLRPATTGVGQAIGFWRGLILYECLAKAFRSSLCLGPAERADVAGVTIRTMVYADSVPMPGHLPGFGGSDLGYKGVGPEPHPEQGGVHRTH
jgi:hypothetical protein